MTLKEATKSAFTILKQVENWIKNNVWFLLLSSSSSKRACRIASPIILSAGYGRETERDKRGSSQSDSPGWFPTNQGGRTGVHYQGTGLSFTCDVFLLPACCVSCDFHVRNLVIQTKPTLLNQDKPSYVTQKSISFGNKLVTKISNKGTCRPVTKYS